MPDELDALFDRYRRHPTDRCLSERRARLAGVPAEGRACYDVPAADPVKGLL